MKVNYHKWYDKYDNWYWHRYILWCWEKKLTPNQEQYPEWLDEHKPFLNQLVMNGKANIHENHKQYQRDWEQGKI